MALQLIEDKLGYAAGIYIPMDNWKELTKKVCRFGKRCLCEYDS
jgi:hypothetical protein